MTKAKYRGGADELNVEGKASIIEVKAWSSSYSFSSSSSSKPEPKSATLPAACCSDHLIQKAATSMASSVSPGKRPKKTLDRSLSTLQSHPSWCPRGLPPTNRKKSTINTLGVITLGTSPKSSLMLRFLACRIHVSCLSAGALIGQSEW